MLLAVALTDCCLRHLTALAKARPAAQLAEPLGPFLPAPRIGHGASWPWRQLRHPLPASPSLTAAGGCAAGGAAGRLARSPAPARPPADCCGARRGAVPHAAAHAALGRLLCAGQRGQHPSDGPGWSVPARQGAAGGGAGAAGRRGHASAADAGGAAAVGGGGAGGGRRVPDLPGEGCALQVGPAGRCCGLCSGVCSSPLTTQLLVLALIPLASRTPTVRPSSLPAPTSSAPTAAASGLSARGLAPCAARPWARQRPGGSARQATAPRRCGRPSSSWGLHACGLHLRPPPRLA